MSIDMRTLDIEFNQNINVEEDEEYYSAEQRISAKLDGNEVGFIQFNYVEQENYETEEKEELIYLALINVEPQYQGLGIGGALYKEFGKIYSDKYSGLPVERHFENPIAEYSFKKAIDEGWVPGEAYSPEKTTRNYDGNKQQLWNDLRQRLPESLYAKRASRIDLRRKYSNFKKTASTLLDLRVDVDISEPQVVMQNDNNKFRFSSYKIIATHEGQEVGALDYSTKEYVNGENQLYVEFLFVDENYRQAGIGQLIYKKFGEVYTQNYDGWGIARVFANPVAEYSFRKAVSMGWFPENALNEDKIEREYSEDDENLWTDLRQKLPENVKGAQNNLSFKLAEAVTISPIEIQTREISNRARKIEILRDGELLADMKYEVYPEHELIYINYLEVQEQFRQNGAAMLLYKTFSEIYNAEYPNWKIGRVFVNPVAEYAFSKAVAEGWFPESTLENVKRDYNPDDEEKWYNELEPKLRDLRNRKKQVV